MSARDEVVLSIGLAGLVAGAGRAAPMASLVGELLPTAGPGTGTAATGAVSVGVPAVSGGTGTLWGGPITTDAAPPARAAARRPAAGNRFNRHDLAGVAARDGRYGCWICVGSGSSGLAAARGRISARFGSSLFVAGARVASVLDSVNRSANWPIDTCRELAAFGRFGGGGSAFPVSCRMTVASSGARRSVRDPWVNAAALRRWDKRCRPRSTSSPPLKRFRR